ncbi:hypothetical protein LFML04_2387 [Leptospirillum ferriphilum ML-04]|uniref:Uncharacterized protein n=1 Tax=Leptospirillum ferriphilum (strain ML-04) TaxID=1048260 RepID=J9ZG08_LEPFM|nr:hypothetical protein LFML04_2387 [Leptospirillum ferriphilum ML-04]
MKKDKNLSLTVKIMTPKKPSRKSLSFCGSGQSRSPSFGYETIFLYFPPQKVSLGHPEECKTPVLLSIR